MFQITFSWSPKVPSSWFSADDFVDASELYMALREFLSQNSGEFYLNFAEMRLRFDLDPDLPTVFEQLPDSLITITKGAEAEIYFFEQGTDIALELRREAENVAVNVRKGLSVGKAFSHFSGELGVVSAQAFVGEWIRFLGAVIDALESRNPALTQDPSLIEYREKLNILARPIKPILVP